MHIPDKWPDETGENKTHHWRVLWVRIVVVGLESQNSIGGDLFEQWLMFLLPDAMNNVIELMI